MAARVALRKNRTRAGGGALEVRDTAHPGPSDYVEAIQAFLEHSLGSRALNSELPLADRSLGGNLYTTAHAVDR